MECVKSITGYEVIIATRNRPDALALSLPLILSQSRKPSRVIIVDASDDGTTTAQVISQVRSQCQAEVLLRRSEPSSAAQRNIGLQLVEEPIVFMPDDDSLWHEGYAEAVMRVYERDTQGCVGAVAGRPSNLWPGRENGGSADNKGYRQRWKDTIAACLRGPRYEIERRYLVDPAWTASLALQSANTTPDWLSEVNAVQVEMITGWRMSFRTELIRARGFDESLGANIGYAAYEDAEACLGVAKTHILTASHDALVYHHRHPGKRADSEKLGFFLNHNRTLIVCRNAPKESKARATLKRFAWYKWLQYSAAITSAEERGRARGAMEAVRAIDPMLAASPEELDECYVRTIPKRYRA